MADFRPEEKDVVYIGTGASLSGAIQARDMVVVHGSVEGEIVCSQLIVGPTGVVSGAISVSDADVHGKLGSDITVKQLLIVRSSGRIEGKFAYGEIEVEKGGTLSGSAQSAENRASDRRSPREERPSRPSYEKPQLIVNESANEEMRVASLASRALRERRRD